MRYASLPSCRITDGALRFDTQAGRAEALRHGVFYVEHRRSPELRPIEVFAKSFFKEPSNTVLTGYKDREYAESVLGYEDRPDQVEQLQLERCLWEKYLPGDVRCGLEEMRGVSDAVVKAAFDEVGVPGSDWDRVLGRSFGDSGLEYCIFNHFRSTMERIGFTEHTDSGFITLIHSVEDGLEGCFDDEWKAIAPRAGHYIAIFGDSMDVLTRDMERPAAALLHRVRPTERRRVEDERFSVGTYIGPRFDMDMYRCDRGSGEVVVAGSFKAFSIQKAKDLGYEFHAKVQ